MFRAPSVEVDDRRVGGLLAYESLHISGRFKLPAVIGWFVLYASFIVAVVVSA